MFLSTDYVFDGTRGLPYEIDDPRNPVNAYGETKARAEERLLEIVPEVCIVRTSWLFGHGGKCFPATILKLAATRPEISVVNDQRGSPTFTPDASCICRRAREAIRTPLVARKRMSAAVKVTTGPSARHIVRACHEQMPGWRQLHMVMIELRESRNTPTPQPVRESLHTPCPNQLLGLGGVLEKNISVGNGFLRRVPLLSNDCTTRNSTGA
jgi:dTDP-4-dehydrorhamnose reductase